MTPLEMIAEWRKGCSCAPAGKPEECAECTRALIDALERGLSEVGSVEIDGATGFLTGALNDGGNTSPQKLGDRLYTFKPRHSDDD